MTAVLSTSLPTLLQSFFVDRLLAQRQASAHTIAGYRDSFRLLLHFAAARLGKAPTDLVVEELDAPFIGPLGSFSSIWSRSGRTPRARATRAWPRSTRSSGTSPGASRHAP